MKKYTLKIVGNIVWKKNSLILAYKIFDKEDKFKEPYILTTLNHFRNNNTYLPLNSNNIKP